MPESWAAKIRTSGAPESLVSRMLNPRSADHRSLHHPAEGAIRFLSGILKTLVDDVQQSLYAYARIKSLYHFLNAYPGLFTCRNESLDDSR